MRLTLRSHGGARAALLFFAASSSWARPTATTTPAETRSLSALTGLLSELPSPGELLDSGLTVLTELLTTLKNGKVVQNGLENLLLLNTTANGTTTMAKVAANGTCPDMAVLFARGTTEPGNVGFLTGPPFFTALQNYMNGTKNIAIQGIDYPASVAGFLAGGSLLGAYEMARLANETATACPTTAIVLSGYSQGAQVVHLATAQLSGVGVVAAFKKDVEDDRDSSNKEANSTTSGNTTTTTSTTAANAATLSRISSVVLFGDPRNGTAVQGIDAGRVLVVCHSGDNICQGGDAVLPAHLNYSSDATAAAMFAMQKSGLGLASQDAMNNGMGNVPSMANPKPSGAGIS